MTIEARRLSRLLAAQRDVARLLEARLVQNQSEVSSQEGAIREITRAMGSVGNSLLMFHGSALVQLSRAEVGLERIKAEQEKLRSRLLVVRSREKILATKTADSKAREQRKRLEEEGLDAALHVMATACHKARVVR